MRRLLRQALVGGLALLASFPPMLRALAPHHAFSQYTRTVWTQAQGLPQDTVRAIAQTPDGYLWVGTNEGLARFDGYDFVTYTKEQGLLPSNTVGKLLVASDGSLWVGTSGGLGHEANGRFQIIKLGDSYGYGPVTGMAEDETGVVWVVSAGDLYRSDHGQFVPVPKARLAPIVTLQAVYVDRHHSLWVGGSGGLVKRSGDTFVEVLGTQDLGGSFVTTLLETNEGMWVAGTKGLMLLRADGSKRMYTIGDGLANNFVIAMLQDHQGNLWAGTYGGLSRLDNGRFESSPRNEKDDHDWVWALFEDREGDLWVGMNGGLNRMHDDAFLNYGRPEGFPSDDPYVVHQDREGVTWVGYHDNGLLAISGSSRRSYTADDGLPSNEIFSIRDTRSGALLIATRQGISLMKGSLQGAHFENDSVLDARGRGAVYDALEDKRGDLWATTARGVYRRHSGRWSDVIPESAGDAAFALSLAEDREGFIWAGTLSSGLWKIDPKNENVKPRLYTVRDGLGANEIRALYPDPDGTLWIGTFGSGLNRFRDGVFTRFRLRDGLPSDNVAHVLDDRQGHLWLSTTRGISRVSRKELADFVERRITALHPENYGLEEGLRSSQCAPASPSSGGGTLTRDGRLWFVTMHNLATISVNEPVLSRYGLTVPTVHLVGMTADGHPVGLEQPVRIEPGTRRVQIRYTAILLSAPERVRYSYRLDGFEKEWIDGGVRRVVNYNPLPHGKYRFLVRASAPSGKTSETSWDFEVMPYFYQRPWFMGLCLLLAALLAWGAYRMHLTRVHDRLALVFEERARMAREIHDTLAQGFVGISAQLDVVAMKLDRDTGQARQHLNLARKMAQHSLTEAKRSVMNLRAGELETSDLSSVLNAAAQRWVAGSPTSAHVEVSEMRQRLPEDVEQNVLRIAQEAVTNVVKHAGASTVRIQLQREEKSLLLRVEDNGRGFEPPVTFSVVGGHFGILGMRERAGKLRAQFQLESSPGRGTQVEVTIPLSENGGSDA